MADTGYGIDYKAEYPIRIVVAGSRDFYDYAVLSERLDFYFSQQNQSHIQIVSGGARGADRLGERYAREHDINYTVFPANWNAHGKAAGMIRNRDMAEYGTHLVAFWDGKSRGTKSMIETARAQGLTIRVVEFTIEPEEQPES